MLSTANEGVWLLDREGQTQFLNDRMAEILGVSRGCHGRAQRLRIRVPRGCRDGQGVYHRDPRVASRASSSFGYGSRTASPVWVRIGTSPVRNDRGRVVGILGLFTDMTGAAALRGGAATRRTSALRWPWMRCSPSSTTGICVPGRSPGAAACNRSWATTRKKRIPRQRGGSTGSTPRRPRSQRLPGRDALDGDRFENEYQVRHRDGHWITVWDQGRIVRDETGAPVRVIGSVIDITARTEAEDALRLLDDAGRALASSLDYEATLQRVAWIAVPRLADWCFVDLIDAQGILRRVAVAHADPAQRALAAQAMQAAAAPRWAWTPRVAELRCLSSGRKMWRAWKGCRTRSKQRCCRRWRPGQWSWCR